MKFLIFDREENYIGNLKDVLEAKHTEEINGEDVLSIATLDKSIGKGYKLVYKDKYGFWKEYIVKEIEESHTNGGIEKRLFCESSFYETFGDYIEDKRPSGTANHALSVALEPTRWEVGIVDNLGTNTTSFYQISAKEAVQKVAETWKGEIRTRVEVVGNKIVHRYVDILERRGGDFGQRFTYSKNLESVTKIIHRDDVITALYGYGKGEEVGDGYGRRIDFADINNGKAYVENNEAKEIWGRNNPDGTKSHVFDKVYFDNCEDKQELLQLTTEKLEEVSSPLITYEAKAIDLGGADLGDSVAVIDTEFTPELRLKARVIKIVRDLIEEENNSLTLGNFIPSIIDSWNKQEEFINNFRGKAGIWDRADIINDDGTINAQFLNNLVDELNQKMNSQGGYVYVSEDGKGLITYDKPIDQDPTMAIQLLGGAFRIANSKLPNGEFDWRTFGAGAGFTADEFVAGVLRGGKVHFDLTNGTFLIGDSIEDYIFYFDGTTLKVRLGTGKTVEESLQEIKDYADTAVDELEIGGRNLLPNTSSEYRTQRVTNYSGMIPEQFGGGIRSLESLGLKAGDMIVGQVYIDPTVTGHGGNLRIDVMLEGEGYQIIPRNTIRMETGEGVSIAGPYAIPSNATELRFYIGNEGTVLDTYDTNYKNLKLEKGNKATDWTPAPEDVDEAISTVDTKYSNKVAEIDTTIDSITQRVESTESDITTINGTVAAHNTRLESAESKITPSAIVDTVRSSTAYTSDLDGKASKNNIISEINQSAEEVQINANRVKIGMGTTFEQGQIYTWEQYAGMTWNQMNS